MGSLTTEALKIKIKEAVQNNTNKNGERINLQDVKTKNKAALHPVIELEVELLNLNPYSHRIKSQIEGDPSWDTLKNEPFSAAAQGLIAKYVKEARSADAFQALKISLDQEGQTQPAIITNEGVLINGNTRAVAIKELTDVRSKIIRVAVIEEDLDAKEIALIEGRLQIQKELKEEYSLTNSLLFVQDLFDKGISDLEIAKELRLDPNPKKGARIVEERKSMLELLNEISRIPKDKIRLHQFDKDESKVTYESLSALLKKQKELESERPEDWEKYQKNWLFCILYGYNTVHNLRNTDEDFFDKFVLSSLKRDSNLGPHFGGLPSRVTDNDDDFGASPMLQGLIDVAASKNNSIDIRGSNFKFPKYLFQSSVYESIEAAVEDKKAQIDNESKKDKPIELIRNALLKLEKCEQYFKDNDYYLDKDTSQKLDIIFKRVQKKVKNIDEILGNYRKD